MAQTQLNYNVDYFGINGEPARIIEGTILSGEGELAAGTVLALNSNNKYVKWDTASQAVVTESGDPDTTTDLDVTPVAGVVVLLEAVNATSGDVTGKVLKSGGIWSSVLVLAGSVVTTVTERVKSILQMNSIHAVIGTNAMGVAGE